MGIFDGLFGGGSTNQTTTYTPPQAVTDAYKYLLSQGQSLTQNPYPQYTGSNVTQNQAIAQNLVAPMNQNQMAGIGTIAGLQGYAQPYYNAASGLAMMGSQGISPMQFSGSAVNQYLSPYLQNVMGSAVANINETNAQQQQQLLGNTISQGAFGGDRAAIAQTELARQQGLANNATLANIANTGYNSALGEFNQQQLANMQAQLQSRQLQQAGAGLLGQLGSQGQQTALQQAQAQMGAGATQQQQQQALLSTAYQQFLNQQAYPYQQLNFLGGLASGAAAGMGGTTTASIPQPSALNQILGIGGALGAMGGAGGIGGLGSSILGGLAFLSDERAKENIEPVGKTFDGQTIHKYNYKGQPGQTHLGLIAQEVERKHPHAVGNIGGLKTVNYDLATAESAHRGHFDGGGSVVPTGGFIPEPLKGGAGFHAPQAPQVSNPNDLSGMVKNIKAMMGDQKDKKDDRPQDTSPKTTPMDIRPDAQKPTYGPSANGSTDWSMDTTNPGGFADGGTITLPYGLETTDYLKNREQDIAGSGVGHLSDLGQTYAAEGVLGAANGGVIRGYADGGPTDTPDFGKIAQDALPLITGVEGGAPGVRNPRSSASGVNQITNDTYRTIVARHPELEGADRSDPKVALANLGDLARAYHGQGIETTPQNLSMGWFLGEKGGPAFLSGMKSDPNVAAHTLASPEAVRSNPEVFFNKDGSPRTAADVLAIRAGNKPSGVAPRPATAPQQAPQAQPSPNQMTPEERIPVQSRATKEGIFGALGVSMTPEQRLAFIQASLKLAGTPGKLGVGLAAAADTYAKTLLEAQGKQREAAGTQAQTERERAQIPLSEAQALEARARARKESTVFGAKGGIYMGEGEAPRYQYVEMPTGPEGSAARSQEGSLSGAQAPKAPTSPVSPEIVAENGKLGPVHDNPIGDQNNKIAVMDRLAKEAVAGQFNPEAKGKNAEEYAKIRSAATDAAQAASDARPSLSQGIAAFTAIPEEGFLKPGFGSATRYAAVNAFNTFAGVIHRPDLIINKEAISAAEEQNKISVLMAQAAQRGLGREAGFWLESLSKASPNAALSKETQADILSNNIIANQMSRDRSSVVTEYGGQKYSAGLGSNANEVFNSVNPQAAYIKDMQAIKSLLMATSGEGKNRRNAITELQKHPERAKEFDEMAAKQFGIHNLSRYFL